MPESSICHTSGFQASEEIARRGPFEDWRSREDRWPKAKEGIYPAVAGTVSGFDDTPLLRVIEACRKAGIEVWGHIGLWSYGGDVYPEYAMVDVEGRPLDMRYRQWGIGLCPSRREINEWARDCLVDVVERYDIDGFDVDHARYPAPANLSSLFACGCEACQGEADRLGYDFVRMKEGLLRVRERLNGLIREQALGAAEACLSFWDFLSWLDGDHTILDWFRFRAVLLAERMQEFREAVREAAGPEVVFGSDVFPPFHRALRWARLLGVGTGSGLSDRREFVWRRGRLGDHGDQSGDRVGTGPVPDRPGPGGRGSPEVDLSAVRV